MGVGQSMAGPSSSWLAGSGETRPIRNTVVVVGAWRRTLLGWEEAVQGNRQSMVLGCVFVAQSWQAYPRWPPRAYGLGT